MQGKRPIKVNGLFSGTLRWWKNGLSKKENPENGGKRPFPQISSDLLNCGTPKRKDTSGRRSVDLALERLPPPFLACHKVAAQSIDSRIYFVSVALPADSQR